MTQGRRTIAASAALEEAVRSLELELGRAEGGRVDALAIRASLEAVRAVEAELREWSEEDDLLERAEAELEATRNQLQSVIGATPIILWSTDADGIITLSEGRALASLGLRGGELVGQRVFDVYASSPEAMASLRRGLAGEAHTAETEVGGRMWSNHYFPQFSADSRVVGLTGISVDVSENKRLEEASRKLEEQVRNTQKLESLGVLAGGIAHDFNNLLAVILGNVEMAERRLGSDSPARAQLETAERAAVRAAELTHQLLVYAGRSRAKIEVVELNALVAELARLLGTVVAKNVRIEYDLVPTLPLIEADPAQLRQVVMNLITNASEALVDRTGTVRLSTGTSTDDARGEHGGEADGQTPMVFLEVRDDGIGMDESTLKRIFDPFFTTKFTGRGLGLAAVSGIIRGHRGRLEVESRPGEGTRFRVLLPSARPLTVRPRPSVPPAGAAMPDRGTVLLVDDEDDVRRMIRAMLEEAGYEVVEASSGEDALALVDLRVHRLTAAVIDIVMPGMNGHALHAALLDRLPGLPVVLISGFELEPPTTTKGAEFPAPLVAKPFQADTLLSALRKVRAEGELASA